MRLITFFRRLPALVQIGFLAAIIISASLATSIAWGDGSSTPDDTLPTTSSTAAPPATNTTPNTTLPARPVPPVSTTTTTTAPPPAPPPEPPSTFMPIIPEAPAYRDCMEVIRAGVAPLLRTDPGYGPHLDPDGDGVACDLPLLPVP